MKKLLLLLCAAVACVSGSYAQMPAAQRIPPAVEKKVTVGAAIGEVWEYVSDPANYKKMSRVKEFWYEGKETGSKIIVTGRSGVERSGIISMKFDEYHRMAFEVKESGYGLENPMHILFEMKPVDDGRRTEVTMSVMYGFDRLPDKAKKDMEQEFGNIASDLGKKFRQEAAKGV